MARSRWGFNWRWHPHIGPIYFNITNGRWTSTSLRLGRYTHNFRTGRDTFDTWGPGSVSRLRGGRKKG